MGILTPTLQCGGGGAPCAALFGGGIFLGTVFSDPTHFYSLRTKWVDVIYMAKL